MKPAIKIRNYRNIDKDACRLLWRELTEHHREIYQEPAIGGEHPEDCFDKYLNKVGPTRIWIAIIDSKVVGLSGLDVSGYEAEIEPLIVTKAHRNKGVGTKLLEKVIAEAHKIGTSLNVSPVARNIKAIRFFHKAGFNKLGRVGMFIDFSNRTWKPYLELHGCKLNY
jgi:GNAT superfamily N-acetyltransferase